MTMKCLVTGAGGFIGSHLVEHLLAQQQSVLALTRKEGGALSSLDGKLEVVLGDLLDEKFLADTLARQEPDIIFHLAAQSLPQLAWKEPALTFRNNLTGALNLFQAARQLPAPPLIVAASSASIYAPAEDGKLLDEDAPLTPDSIYAASKLSVEHLGGVFNKSFGLKIIFARPFFIIGPRKTGDVSSAFARGIVGLERGKARELRVGNLAIIRDFLDVHDCVSGFWQVATAGKAGRVYNICSGKGISTGELLELFKQHARVAVKPVVDRTKFRQIDVPVKIGAPFRLMALGWKPGIAIEDAVKNILDYWRGMP